MNVRHPAYPTTEYGGLVFVYMGPAGTEPLLPLYDTQSANVEIDSFTPARSKIRC